jgi:succinate dehydrogenase/fumarate reductase flavoprotein subunit
MNENFEVVTVETDVLIIGGGLAGCMAAIKAREHGVRVTIAEKSNTICSGQAGSGIDHMWAYVPDIHGKMGWTIEDLVEDHVDSIGHGFAQRGLLHLIARQSYDRLLDLERFGLTIRYKDSSLPGGLRLVHQFHSVPTALNVDGRPLKAILTREVKQRGVMVVNRVTMTDLLTCDGSIAGALGVGTRDGRIYVFKAKGVVICTGGKTGRLCREPTGIDFNLHLPPTLAGDGKAMAIKAGLPVMNMEFISPRRAAIAYYDISGGAPRNTWQPAGSIVDSRGRTIVPPTHFYEWGDLKQGYRLNAAESRRQWIADRTDLSVSMQALKTKPCDGPYYLDCTAATDEEIRYVEWALSNEGKCNHFLNHLKEERVDLRRDKLEFGFQGREVGNLSCAGLVVDGDLQTEIEGLFAAGDEVGGTPFTASTGAFAMGWHSGEMAAKHALKENIFRPVDDSKVESLKRICMDMTSVGRGSPWKEVEYALQNVMDIYCGEVRTETMLRRGIERLAGIQSVPLKAENLHELGRCLEVGFLITNAELVMRASIERQESRKYPAGFQRADYPEQDDEHWRVFLALRRERDGYAASKLPIG